MSIDEMIEVLQAYKEGKEIEYYDVILGVWKPLDKPTWNFPFFKYRVKRKTTNLEIANKLMKEKFGIDECFDEYDCALPFKKDACPGPCSECVKWWNEEY